MKKTMLLTLTLMVMSAASMNAQVKIGGDGIAGAVLELDGSQGALVYCKADGKLYTCTGAAWVVADADTQYVAATTADLGLVKIAAVGTSNITNGVLSVHKKCDGAIVYKAAWDYNVVAAPYYFPGDSARVTTVADNTTDQTWSPNIVAVGYWSAGENVLDPYLNLCLPTCVFIKSITRVQVLPTQRLIG